MEAMPLPEPIGVQKEVVALEPRGHVVVLGTAGSGKTTMAVHRAALVSDPRVPNNGPTLLLTFNRSLLRYLKYLVPTEIAARLTIENYHKFARGYLHSRDLMGGWSTIVPDDAARRALIDEAAANVFERDADSPLRTFPADVVAGEIAWLAQHGLDDRAAYLATDVGDHEARLEGDQRDALFDIYEEYLRVRTSSGRGYRYDWYDIASAVRRELERDDRPQHYKHIVLDEGQDFSPEMLRSLVAAVPPDGSLSFFGDAAQQIYGRRISWRDAGLQVSGPILFRKNYRNTKEIADLGLAIAAMPYYADEPDMVAPDEFRAAGPKPTLVRFPNEDAEVRYIVQQAREAAASGQSVAILVRRQQDVNRFATKFTNVQRLDDETTIWRPGAGVSCGTAHGGKGLEFETVFLPLLTDAHFPDPALVAIVGGSEADAIDGRLLYVGVTRARQNLVLSCAATLSRLLPTTPGLWLEVEP
jgi:superfamily I DNA/RNA helicase